MDIFRLVHGKQYLYKGKLVTYVHPQHLNTPVRYLFKGSRGGDISLSENQVHKYVSHVILDDEYT